MSNIVVFPCIITADTSTKSVFVCSENDSSVIFPTFQISYPKMLYDEMRMNIKNMFNYNTIKFCEEIIVSFLDIQNHLLIDLLESKPETYPNIKEDDIILLCGVVLHDKVESDTIHWIHINSMFLPKNISNTINDDNKIIQYVLDRIVL